VFTVLAEADEGYCKEGNAHVAHGSEAAPEAVEAGVAVRFAPVCRQRAHCRYEVLPRQSTTKSVCAAMTASMSL